MQRQMNKYNKIYSYKDKNEIVLAKGAIPPLKTCLEGMQHEI